METLDEIFGGLSEQGRRQRIAERVQFRPIEDSDLPAVLDILNDAFGGWGWRDPAMSESEWARFQAEHLEWKLHSPYASEIPSLVAEVDSHVIMVLMSIPRRMRVWGQVERVFGGGNRATHPAAQHSGLTKLFRPVIRRARREAGFSFAVLTSVRQRTEEERRVLGDRLLGNGPHVFLKVRDARAYAVERRRRGQGGRLPVVVATFAIRAAALANRLRWRPFRDPLPPTIRIRAIDRFDQRVDALVERAAEEFDFITDWNSEYLNWRFCDPRAGRFTVLVAEEGDELLGFIVCKVEGIYGYIGQLLALPGREDAVRALAEAGTKVLEDASVAVIQCALPRRHPYTAILRRTGFVDSRRAMTFYLRPVDPDWQDRVDELTAPDARIHVMYGDLDGI